MKLNTEKIYKYLCTVSFNISLFVFIIFVIICLFGTLQIKFSLFGNFFSDLLYKIDWLRYTHNLITPHFSKPMYMLFILCYLVKQSYIPVFVFGFNLAVIYLCEKFKLLIFFLLIVLINIPIFYNNSISIFLLRFIDIYIIFILFNYIISKNNIIIRSLILIPILNIFVFPIVVFKHYKSNRFVFFTSTGIILLLLNLFSISCINATDYRKLLKNTFIKQDVYNLENLDGNKIISVLGCYKFNYIDINTLNWNIMYLYDKEKEKAFHIFQYIRVNEDKNEVYAYNNVEKKLLVLDAGNFKIKKEKLLNDDIAGAERLAFDNVSNTICLVLDRGTAFIFDMDTLNILQQISIPVCNDGVIFNKDTNSYILTFWTCTDYFISIPLDTTKPAEKHKCLKNQGYIEYSNRNKELYICFHQQGLIGIYDSNTYELKRYIKTLYSVKNIYYNEEYNILFAPSYFTGYMDIFLMDGKDTLIETKFIGFFPRSPLYSHKKLFVPSYCGLRIYNLDLENLIKKYDKK